MIKRIVNFVCLMVPFLTIFSACGNGGEGIQGNGKADLKIVFAPSGTIAVQPGPPGKIVTSTDLTTWARSSSGVDPADPITTIKHLNNLYIGLTPYGGIYTSADSVTWSKKLTGTTNFLKDVAYNGSLFVVVGSQGTILTSPDANNWTLRSSGISGTLNSISYGVGRFVAVESNTSSSVGFLSSTDGITWSPNNAFVSGDSYNQIIFANNNFVTCTTSGKIYTSADGLTLSGSYTINISDDPLTANPDPFVLNSYNIAFGNGVYVVYGYKPSEPNRVLIATSPNLTTWTLRTTGQTGRISTFTYNSVFSSFISNSITATNNSIYTSPDGITWSAADIQNYVAPPDTTTPLPAFPNGVSRVTIDAIPDDPTHFAPATLNISAMAKVSLPNLYDSGVYTILISGYNQRYEKIWQGKNKLVIQAGTNQISIDVTPFTLELDEKAFKTSDFTNKIYISSSMPSDAKMFFNPNGSITWTGIPSNVSNGLWKVRPDGSFVKFWTDSTLNPTNRWGVYRIVSNFKPVYVLEGLRSDGARVTDTIIDMSSFVSQYEGRYIVYGTTSAKGGKVFLNVDDSGHVTGTTSQNETISGMLSYFSSTELGFNATTNNGVVLKGRLAALTKQFTGTWEDPTFGKGGFSASSVGVASPVAKNIITGIVVDPDQNPPSNLIANATINVYEQPLDISKLIATTPVKVVTSDNSGYFEVDNLTIGTTYYFEIKKQGYPSINYFNIIPDGNPITLQTVVMMPDSWLTSPTGQTATVQGVILNSLDGVGLPGLNIKLRKGLNNKTGVVVPVMPDIITSQSIVGAFASVLPLGVYTAEVTGNIGSKPIITTYFTLYSMKDPSPSSTVNIHQDFSVLPSAGGTADYRIILNWGNNPSDLDSHLTGPTDNPDARFHLYYGNSVFPAYSPFDVWLDGDKTTHGTLNVPEVITIEKSRVGKYRYYVHHFSGADNISTSGASVQLYKGDKLINTFYPPQNGSGSGDVWSVFTLEKTTAGEIITSTNTIGLNNTSTLAKPVVGSSFDSALLFKNLPRKR